MPTSDTDVLVLSHSQVADLYDAETAYQSQVLAFTAIGDGVPKPSEKIMLEQPEVGALTFTYAARLPPFGAVCKFGSVNPANAEHGIATVNATVLALDAATGRLVAILEGTAITTRRTAAATMVAVDALASPGELCVAVVGSGVQAGEHVRMLAARGRTRRVRVTGRSALGSSAFAHRLRQETGLDIVAARGTDSAVADADVVLLCTTVHEPLVRADRIRAGALVVSLGSISPTRCEVGQDLVARTGRVIVDDLHSAQVQAGPVVAALASGLLAAADLVGLGDVLVGHRAGRRDPDEVVFYNSTGIGLQDAAAAATVIARARERHVGQHINLWP